MEVARNLTMEAANSAPTTPVCFAHTHLLAFKRKKSARPGLKSAKQMFKKTKSASRKSEIIEMTPIGKNCFSPKLSKPTKLIINQIQINMLSTSKNPDSNKNLHVGVVSPFSGTSTGRIYSRKNSVQNQYFARRANSQNRSYKSLKSALDNQKTAGRILDHLMSYNLSENFIPNQSDSQGSNGKR